MYVANVIVTLKQSVLDPQGTTIKHAVDSLGYNSVEDVRMGKFFEVKLKGSDKEKLEQDIKEISEKLLSNPVIETYRYEIKEEGK